MVANWYVYPAPDQLHSVCNYPPYCTELGGIAIAPHAKMSLDELKPGFIMKPSFGVIPCLIDNDVITLQLYIYIANILAAWY